MDQSEADWGDWSLNNDGGLSQLDTDFKQELVDDEQRLTAYDEDPQKDPVEFRMYEDDAGLGSGSGDSDGSEFEDGEDGGELQKELLGRGSERGPLGLLQPQGMVMCEFCGKLGVRDAFYSKSKRFCTVNCSKNFASAQKEGTPTPYALMQTSIAQNKSKGKRNYLKSQFVGQKGIKHESGDLQAFDWSSYLDEGHANAAPVSCFKHCLMSDSWDNIAVGMKVEVVNKDCDLDSEAYWIATVIQLAGYRAQMRYEGFGNDSSVDFWMSLCSKDVHPVGWCAANGKSLVPPKTIIHKYLDWKDFLVKRLTGARTLPQTFYAKVQESLNNTPLKKGMFVEVVDKMCVSAMRVARVEDIIGGRLKLHYLDSKVENDEFWCHHESPLVHHVGWSQIVGHKLHASSEYKADCLAKNAQKKYDESDSTPEMFKKNKSIPGDGKFQVGMKLEAIDPLNLSSICVASVTKVLRNSYLMIGIDGSLAENGTDWFCYHASSPCIFPVGFCEINNLDINPPRDRRNSFKWFDYLKEMKCSAAPVKLFDKTIPRHGFKVGMKLEAVDLMEPRLICVATIKQIVGRLLRIHFDGWEDSYDQWVDCNSADIYPVGWCEMVDYHLEGPRQVRVEEPLLPHSLVVPKKRKTKTQMYRGQRKKRKSKLPPCTPGKGGMSSDISQDSFTTANSETGTNPASVTGVTIKQEVVDLDDSHGANGAGNTGAVTQVSDRSSFDNTSPSGSPQRVPSKTTNSTLASSMPSITSILNSPVRENTSQRSSPNVSPHYVNKASASSSSPSGQQVFTLKGQSTVYTLTTSPTTSPGGSTLHVFRHNLPRLVSGEPDKDSSPPVSVNTSNNVDPEKWGVLEVAQFLKINDCVVQSDCFRKKNIDGPKFLALSKEQIVNSTGMKVGPSIKIYDLIQALKAKMFEQNKAKGLKSRVEGDKDTGTANHITASLLLKKRGLLQNEHSEKEITTDTKGQLFTQHLINNSPTSISKHSLAMKAQPSQ